MKPTKQQELIIDHNGCAVVIASPGSGKTYVLSNKIKQNLKELKEHQGVIAISYTNKASNELRSRSLSDGENPKSSFFGTIDKFYISEIIVPFGKQIWGIPENEITVDKIDSLEKEEQELLNWFSRDIVLSKIADFQLDILKKFFEKGLILIETIGLIGNYLFSKSIACQKYLKARYKYLYIDEYQDSGYYQHEMFLKIKELGIVSTAVGDLNQSIYAFSGKDSKFLESLISNKSFKYFVLNKNHRCHPSIINYSNYLLNTKTELIDCEHNLIWFNRIEGAEKEVSEWIDKIVPTILSAFNFKEHNKIAVLTRTGRTAQAINSHLKTNHKLFVTNELDLNLNVWSGIFSNLLLYLLDTKHRFIEVVEEFTLYEKLSRKKKNELLD
jgi:DNA helicase-2/ATP-dependent DNA helicase PcrA